MKLFILEPVEGLPNDDNPWRNQYDKVHGFVVRAKSEQHAREIAQKNGSDECTCWTANTKTPWLDPKYTTCKVLSARSGEAGLVMRDYMPG